ncbi:MAG TPA: oligosaccharide flippase family protein [Chthoniobacteraceae bacterium]|jgi:O-antigen/teichoic acid export membrane protein|nr:oligosaccharide flippase family protein [Chthoniobacteraceae bacterium]
MAGSQKIIAALHANWWLSLAGLLISFVASVVLVRSVPPQLFAQFSAVMAIAGVATLLFEAGANSGLTRYLNEAAGQQASGTFYLQMQRRRWLAALACAAALIAFGPMYARSTQLGAAATPPWLFVLLAVLVAGTLTRLLAHYGLLALFETRTALLLQQGFLVLRSVALAAIGLAGGGLAGLIAALLVITLVEAFLAHRRFWRLVESKRAPISNEFINRAQTFGLVTIFDKACAMLGSGSVILLVLAPHHPATVIAFLALAVDLVGKVVSLTVMPMGNLVAPYLSQTSDDAETQGRAIARVLKLSSLLYSFTIGAALLLFPAFIGLVYGGKYDGAIGLTLLLLVPTGFENWIRGCCSPALLRNGHSRSLMRLNIVQAIATVATFVLVRHQPIEIVLAGVGGVRAAVASLNLLLLRPLVPARSYRVPLQGALIGLLSCALASMWGSLLPLPPAASAAVQGLSFALLFYIGLRCVVLRDPDTLNLAHRIAGTRARLFAWLLPPVPLLNR